MKKLIIFIFMFILMNIKNVSALSCEYNKLNELKELANNVNIVYEPIISECIDINDKSASCVDYKVYIENLNEDLKIYYKDYNNINKVYEKSLIYNSGEKIEFSIYSYTLDVNCTNQLLKKQTIKLPYYNDWYKNNKKKCDKNNEFKYCKEYLSSYKSQDEINKLYKEFISEKSINEGENNNGVVIIVIIILFILLLSVMSYFVIKSRKKTQVL